MPDFRNDDDSDHDRLVEMTALVRKHDEEIRLLRHWRHDIATPHMVGQDASYKRCMDAIERLTSVVSDHQMTDLASFGRVDAGIDALHEKIDRNRNERAEGERRIILWVGGIVAIGLMGVIAAMWGMLLPHLPWH